MKKTFKIMFASLLISAILGSCNSSGISDNKASKNSLKSNNSDENLSSTEEKNDNIANVDMDINEEEPEKFDIDRECLYQVSLLQDLTQGDYYGSITVGALKERGNIGLGTFNKLNGELIMLDGKVFRADGDGKVEEVSDDETVPFASITFFDEDDKSEITDVENLNDVIEKLDENYTKEAGNYFQVIKITGTFEKMNVRSELAQEEPYKPLAEVMETDQRFFDYENISGTVVGVYCPVYMDKLNSSGWHFHFISEDESKGGHVVDFKLKNGEVLWDKTMGLDIDLPEVDSFEKYDFSTDQSEDVKKVEKPKD